MPNARVIDLAFSPWSEKVRWVLDWKGVPYEREEFLVGLGDRALRRLSGQTEVPVYVDPSGRAIADSTRIVLHLEEAHPEPPLLPADPALRAEALRWQDWAGDVLGPAARAASIAAVSKDLDAARATIPPSAPWFAKTVGAVATGVALQLFRRDYELDDHAVEKARWRLPILLGEIDAALADGRRFLVGGAFTLADIAVAASFLLIDPPADAHLVRPMAPPLRRAFTFAEARERFPRALAWRDAIYESHRRPAAVGAAS